MNPGLILLNIAVCGVMTYAIVMMLHKSRSMLGPRISYMRHPKAALYSTLLLCRGTRSPHRSVGSVPNRCRRP